MSLVPRCRILAGPNGSGKSTLYSLLRAAGKFPFGYYLNADDIDRELNATGRFYFGGWGTRLTSERLAQFVSAHPLAARLAGQIPIVDRETLVAPPEYKAGYFTTIFADFLRREWIAQRESFTFETVFSSFDKVESMRAARDTGFRAYLYFVCTNTPLINDGRVANRVAQGGHDVPSKTIHERYARSLTHLPDAIGASSRAYLFDNSSASLELVVEFESGHVVWKADVLPLWITAHPTLRLD